MIQTDSHRKRWRAIISQSSAFLPLDCRKSFLCVVKYGKWVQIKCNILTSCSCCALKYLSVGACTTDSHPPSTSMELKRRSRSSWSCWFQFKNSVCPSPLKSQSSVSRSLCLYTSESLNIAKDIFCRSVAKFCPVLRLAWMAKASVCVCMSSEDTAEQRPGHASDTCSEQMDWNNKFRER